MTWTEKPPSGTVLDTGHSLYTGLEVCIPFYEGTGTSVYDPKRDLSYTLPSSSMWDVSGGILIDADTEYFPVTYDATSLDDFTILIGGYVFNSGSTGNYATFISSTNGTQFRLYRTYTRLNMLAHTSDNRFESISWAEVSDSTAHNIFCVGKFSTQSATMYFDGSTTSYTMTLTGTPAITTSTGFNVGGRGGTGFHADGVIDFVYLYNRQLSTAEIDSINTNPWQIFLDATGQTGEVSDGVTVSSALAPLANYIVSASDGVSGSSAKDPLGNYSRASNDSGMSSETTFPLGNYTASLASAITSQGDQSALGQFISSLADSTTAEETTSAIGQYLRNYENAPNITEQFVTEFSIIGMLADSVTVSGESSLIAAFSASGSDTSSAVELFVAIKALIGAFSDNITITSTQTAYTVDPAKLTMTLSLKAAKITFSINDE